MFLDKHESVLNKMTEVSKIIELETYVGVHVKADESVVQATDRQVESVTHVVDSIAPEVILCHGADTRAHSALGQCQVARGEQEAWPTCLRD